MSRQLEAVLMIAEYPSVKPYLMPIVDKEHEQVHWDRLNYGVLSGGLKAAVSWAWCIWTDTQVPRVEADWREYPGYPMRDPFEGFVVMDAELQFIVLQALAHRGELDREP